MFILVDFLVQQPDSRYFSLSGAIAADAYLISTLNNLDVYYLHSQNFNSAEYLKTSTIYQLLANCPNLKKMSKSEFSQDIYNLILGNP